MVTAGTYQKSPYFTGEARLAHLQEMLLSLAAEHGWQLEAWAIFPNHYHFVGHAPAGAEQLRPMLRRLHASSSKWVNELDAMAGRKVWHNFWDTLLTYERSYLARLNYVHQNAVGHGVVRKAADYPWCSARWFESNASPAQLDTIYGFKLDRVKVPDDFIVECGA